MSTQILSTTVPANDTFADFKTWAQAISAWMASIGWTQTNDTGQVVWTATVLTATQVAMSGTTATVSYSSFTGPAPRAGMSVTWSGFSNGGNNSTFTLTAVSGGSSGTVQMVNASGVNETHAGSGTTTANTTVPGTSAFFYDTWVSTDSASSTLPIYLKLEYGASSVAANPSFALTAGTGSNGSGTLTGNVSARNVHINNTNSTTAVESDFSGSTGRVAVLMHRTTASTVLPFFFAIERAHDSSGNDLDSYFVVYCAFGSSGTRSASMQIVQKPALGGVLTSETEFVSALTTLSSGIVGTSVALGCCFPVIGKLDNPTMAIAFSKGGDIVEGATVSVALYGSSHTFFCTKFNSVWTGLPRVSGTANGFLFRFE
jgi:hypothetical protein